VTAQTGSDYDIGKTKVDGVYDVIKLTRTTTWLTVITTKNNPLLQVEAI